jgi:hypothetical protein
MKFGEDLFNNEWRPAPLRSCYQPFSAEFHNGALCERSEEPSNLTPDRIVELLDVIGRICASLASGAIRFRPSARRNAPTPRFPRHCPIG